MTTGYSIDVEHIGRSGYVHYQCDGRTARFEIEMSVGTDYVFVIYFKNNKEWQSPANTPFEKAEKQLIKARLGDWLKRTNKPMLID